MSVHSSPHTICDPCLHLDVSTTDVFLRAGVWHLPERFVSLYQGIVLSISAHNHLFVPRFTCHLSTSASHPSRTCVCLFL